MYFNEVFYGIATLKSRRLEINIRSKSIMNQQESSSSLRIVSLLPSATEVVIELGFGPYLVGRSHECDYPKDIVEHLPICTQAKFNRFGSSIEIHNRVNDLLQTALSVYRIETDVLVSLQPTHIITQSLCEICAVSLSDVERVVHELFVNATTATTTTKAPEIISLRPMIFKDLWSDLHHVLSILAMDDTDKLQQGEAIIKQLQNRVNYCCSTVQDVINTSNDSTSSSSNNNQQKYYKPKVVCIEWTNPLMSAGNWVPELVDMVGGHSVFGTIGCHAPMISFQELEKSDPDIILLMPCGYDMEQTKQDAKPLFESTTTTSDSWRTLRAVQMGQIYAINGNHYFNRPGPRLVDSLEILAEILHPSVFHFGYNGHGWQHINI